MARLGNDADYRSNDAGCAPLPGPAEKRAEPFFAFVGAQPAYTPPTFGRVTECSNDCSDPEGAWVECIAHRCRVVLDRGAGSSLGGAIRFRANGAYRGRRQGDARRES